MSEKRLELLSNIFSEAELNFDSLAMEVWDYQYRENKIYHQYCDLILRGEKPKSIQEIPYLPIIFFKSHQVISGTNIPEMFFESSGTTNAAKSRHYITDAQVYEKSFLKNFIACYGNPDNICISGLLPSYIEQGNSSLVYMVNDLINRSDKKGSDFYLYNTNELAALLTRNEAATIPTILIGVTYALLDFFETFPLPLKHTIVMETGGMKGRKKEMIRAEVHEILKKQTGLSQIHSEYGMTELFSQAYAHKDGIFQPAATMKILIRPQDDPLKNIQSMQEQESVTGLINIIDLANIDSCSFIATEDAGILYKNGTFEVTGRFDNSDARGCSLMIV